jgi:dTDP-4-amino-4,6-dideoxygalactose transaminase
MFYIILPSEADRNRLISFLQARSIQAVFHYVPLHTSPMGRKMGHSDGDLPVTENLAARLLRLPCYFELEKSDQDRVVTAIEEYFQPRPKETI